MENETQESCRWFAPLAQILMTTGVVLTGTYFFQEAMEGKFPWWPYPAFALFSALLFLADWLITRKK